MDELKTLYGQAFAYYDDEEIGDSASYYWFNPREGRAFGIRKSAITDKELNLLKLWVPIGDPPDSTLSTEQKKWSDYLFKGSTLQFDLSGHLTQFIFVQFKTDRFDRFAFEEVIEGYFPKPATILWTEGHFAIIIVSVEPTELPNGEALLELIHTDFLVNAKLAFGSPFREATNARRLYSYEKETFGILQKAYPDRDLFSYSEFLPLTLLLNGSDEDLTLYFATLTDYLDKEPDLRHHLDTFFDCNLNVSTTAKSLFMHRNSLLYRFDKLKEKTGLDPRDFKDAQLIHLELLFNKRKH